MNQSEVISFIVQLRSKLDEEIFTSEDAYSEIWGQDNPLNHDQRVQVHHALELPYNEPNELDLFFREPIHHND